MNLNFSNVHILIVGDIMLDRYHFGDVTRISPEAPVPIVRVKKTTETLGGAANVANNVAHLGAKTLLIGLVGNDAAQKTVKKLASKVGISTAFVKNTQPTITKTRIIGAHQQMIRLDFEETLQANSQTEEKIIAQTLAHLSKTQCLIISDYGKGVCTPYVCKQIISAARALHIPVIVDPKTDDWSRYSNATFVTPNLKELAMAVRKNIENDDTAVTTNGKFLLKKYRVDNVLVTRSEKGMTLVTPKQSVHMHSRAQEVFDVSGAGDTVVASFAVASAAGNTLNDSLEIANYAAGIVVAKVGTVPVEIKELKKLLQK